MNQTSKSIYFLFTLLSLGMLSSCGGDMGQTGVGAKRSSIKAEFYYKMKARVLAEEDSLYAENSNIFEEGSYDPNHPKDLDKLLIEMGRIYRLDSMMIVKFDIKAPEELAENDPEDTLIVGKETFTRNLHDITESELRSLRYNLAMIGNLKSKKQQNGSCQGIDCPVYAHVSKRDQRLYLYLKGEPLDTFKISTGKQGHLTPNFETQPDGRMFRKYSSHQFPGGNWNGLSNMPYAVFIEGGYAIHGTTIGNIPKLGTTVSQGCIRIHPKNAKIFYNLVHYAGKENTWITVD